jgi:hypothetical protein
MFLRGPELGPIAICCAALYHRKAIAVIAKTQTLPLMNADDADNPKLFLISVTSVISGDICLSDDGYLGDHLGSNFSSCAFAPSTAESENAREKVLLLYQASQWSM